MPTRWSRGLTTKAGWAENSIVFFEETYSLKKKCIATKRPGNSVVFENMRFYVI
jgi:hypothetical protein